MATGDWSIVTPDHWRSQHSLSSIVLDPNHQHVCLECFQLILPEFQEHLQAERLRILMLMIKIVEDPALSRQLDATMIVSLWMPLVQAMVDTADQDIGEAMTRLAYELCQHGGSAATQPLVQTLSVQLMLDPARWLTGHFHVVHLLGKVLSSHLGEQLWSHQPPVSQLTVETLVSGLRVPWSTLRGEIMFVLYILAQQGYYDLPKCCPSLPSVCIEVLTTADVQEARLNTMGLLAKLAEQCKIQLVDGRGGHKSPTLASSESCISAASLVESLKTLLLCTDSTWQTQSAALSLILNFGSNQDALEKLCQHNLFSYVLELLRTRIRATITADAADATMLLCVQVLRLFLAEPQNDAAVTVDWAVLLQLFERSLEDGSQQLLEACLLLFDQVVQCAPAGSLSQGDAHHLQQSVSGVLRHFMTDSKHDEETRAAMLLSIFQILHHLLELHPSASWSSDASPTESFLEALKASSEFMSSCSQSWKTACVTKAAELCTLLVGACNFSVVETALEVCDSTIIPHFIACQELHAAPVDLIQASLKLLEVVFAMPGVSASCLAEKLLSASCLSLCFDILGQQPTSSTKLAVFSFLRMIVHKVLGPEQSHVFSTAVPHLPPSLADMLFLLEKKGHDDEECKAVQVSVIFILYIGLTCGERLSGDMSCLSAVEKWVQLNVDYFDLYPSVYQEGPSLLDQLLLLYVEFLHGAGTWRVCESSDVTSSFIRLINDQATEQQGLPGRHPDMVLHWMIAHYEGLGSILQKMVVAWLTEGLEEMQNQQWFRLFESNSAFVEVLRDSISFATQTLSGESLLHMSHKLCEAMRASPAIVDALEAQGFLSVLNRCYLTVSARQSDYQGLQAIIDILGQMAWSGSIVCLQDRIWRELIPQCRRLAMTVLEEDSSGQGGAEQLLSVLNLLNILQAKTVWFPDELAELRLSWSSADDLQLLLDARITTVQSNPSSASQMKHSLSIVTKEGALLLAAMVNHALRTFWYTQSQQVAVQKKRGGPGLEVFCSLLRHSPSEYKIAGAACLWAHIYNYVVLSAKRDGGANVAAPSQKSIDRGTLQGQGQDEGVPITEGLHSMQSVLYVLQDALLAEECEVRHIAALALAALISSSSGTFMGHLAVCNPWNQFLAEEVLRSLCSPSLSASAGLPTTTSIVGVEAALVVRALLQTTSKETYLQFFTRSTINAVISSLQVMPSLMTREVVHLLRELRRAGVFTAQEVTKLQALGTSVRDADTPAKQPAWAMYRDRLFLLLEVPHTQTEMGSFCGSLSHELHCFLKETGHMG